MQFLAVILTALALVPAGAHLFALPNKLGMSQEAYFTVQQIYRGWALLGSVLAAALMAIVALAVLLRRQPAPFWLAFVAAGGIVAVLAVFFIWTYPANQATQDWTVAPADWQALRRQWEFSHALNAAITFVALMAVTLSVLTARR